MFYRCNLITAPLRYLIVLTLGLVYSHSHAEPYLAFKTNNKCSACHINPSGGGARNSFGAYYGSQMLPATLGNIDNVDGAQISENFRIGGDLRFNYDSSDNDSNDAQSFNTQSGQLYITIQPKDSPISLYVDQQIAPGSSFSREAFMLAKFGGSNYLKAGKIMLPYGIRLEDDSAFIRQATGINFDNSDNGVELGFESAKSILNVALSNGTTGTNNDDENFQYAVRGEFIGNNWRIGASAVINDAESGQRQFGNMFGGFNLGGFIFLAEVDRIEDESIVSVDGENEVQYASFFEVNKELKRGYNLKLTTEYFDPDDNIEENERTRHSLLLEYTPYAYLQIRGGIRNGDDIPQREIGNFTDVFVQLHMYY